MFGYFSKRNVHRVPFYLPSDSHSFFLALEQLRQTQFKNIKTSADAQILIPSNKDLLKRFPDLISPG